MKSLLDVICSGILCHPEQLIVVSHPEAEGHAFALDLYSESSTLLLHNTRESYARMRPSTTIQSKQLPQSDKNYTSSKIIAQFTRLVSMVLAQLSRVPQSTACQNLDLLELHARTISHNTTTYRCTESKAEQHLVSQTSVGSSVSLALWMTRPRSLVDTPVMLTHKLLCSRSARDSGSVHKYVTRNHLWMKCALAQAGF